MEPWPISAAHLAMCNWPLKEQFDKRFICVCSDLVNISKVYQIILLYIWRIIILKKIIRRDDYMIYSAHTYLFLLTVKLKLSSTSSVY